RFCFAMMLSSGLGGLNGGADLVEQRRLLKHFNLAADAAFGSDIGVAGVAPSVRSEIGLGFYERARIGDDVQDALIKALCGNRFGEEFGYPGIARHRDAPFF